VVGGAVVLAVSEKEDHLFEDFREDSLREQHKSNSGEAAHEVLADGGRVIDREQFGGQHETEPAAGFEEQGRVDRERSPATGQIR